MDNNGKSVGEEMAETINKLNGLFDKLRAEHEAKIPAEQRAEYEKICKQNGVDKAVVELKNKFEQLKNMTQTNG